MTEGEDVCLLATELVHLRSLLIAFFLELGWCWQSGDARVQELSNSPLDPFGILSLAV